VGVAVLPGAADITLFAVERISFGRAERGLERTFFSGFDCLLGFVLRDDPVTLKLMS
jgi:hypothetical protein